MAKFIVDSVIGGGGITTNVVPSASTVGAGTMIWDSTSSQNGSGVFSVSDGTNYSLLTQIRVLAQNGLPLIVPSSGTFSAAGALSALTALPATYAACYMFFPANAIATVSVAGMYFVQMSSATAGTAFQNMYTSGTPTAPATSALIPCTTASSYTQTTGSGLTIYTANVPANAMGANGKLRFDGTFTNNNSAGTKTPILAFGGTTIFTSVISTNLTMIILKRITNMGVTNAQSTDGAVGNLGSGAAAAAAPIYSAIDTTAATTVTVTMNLNTATDFGLMLNSTLELIPQS